MPHEPDDATLRDLHRQMVRIRRFEQTLQQAYLEGKTPAFDIAAGPVPGEMHLAAGQEPVAAGVCAHLRPADAITATHRPHHVALAHGMDMKRMTAEIFGKETGLGRGKGGHMHLFDTETNFGCSGIIAEGMPTAVGHALAFKRLGKDAIAVSFFGEGAANQGAFHESLNLAAIWKVPVVFVCEDNDWAISVPKDKATAVPNNSDRAAAYGMPGVLVPDNDVIAVYEAAGEAVDRARRGDGPSLIEVKTQRMLGHFEGDPQLYRSAEEMEGLQSHDALARFERQLTERGGLSAADIERVHQECQAEVDEAFEFARSSPYPAPESALEHVFA
ncbi:MAG TPA: thiamine pyrophosphate-dependent dehydrogenase E1 component subunit alpha [Egicoccus sp.]|nr:thiamine pyrophosphate-dependent dehydrogenase E1 component subunit alpha [Egicoccus sp.]HSK21586.1 thiamine pyrophosphate-dependent dehydrogenase E1 component subunit alpha [Egicoccus sp.]